MRIATCRMNQISLFETEESNDEISIIRLSDLKLVITGKKYGYRRDDGVF